MQFLAMQYFNVVKYNEISETMSNSVGKKKANSKPI